MSGFSAVHKLGTPAVLDVCQSFMPYLGKCALNGMQEHRDLHL